MTTSTATASEEFDAGAAARSVVEWLQGEERCKRRSDDRQLGRELIRELEFRGYRLVRDPRL